MSFDILLDSSLAKLERGGERNVSHDFTVNFYPRSTWVQETIKPR